MIAAGMPTTRRPARDFGALYVRDMNPHRARLQVEISPG
jgi:hypothetical protein